MRHEITKPEGCTRAFLFVPGGSPKDYSDWKADTLSRGWAWAEIIYDDRTTLTIAMIQEEIRTVLSDLDCQTVVFGKSYGGLCLLTSHFDCAAFIFWAPFAHVGEVEFVLPTVPVLIVHGDADTTMPLENSEKIVAMLPDACLEVVEGGGHSTKKDEVWEKVKEFLVDKL